MQYVPGKKLAMSLYIVQGGAAMPNTCSNSVKGPNVEAFGQKLQRKPLHIIVF